MEGSTWQIWEGMVARGVDNVVVAETGNCGRQLLREQQWTRTGFIAIGLPEPALAPVYSLQPFFPGAVFAFVLSYGTINSFVVFYTYRIGKHLPRILVDRFI